MGTNKALLLWEGVPLVARVARLLAEATGEVVVVTRHPAELAGLGLTVVEDEPGPQTPLSGIRTALHLAGGRPLFVAACDMPYLSPPLIQALLALAAAHDAVVPLHHFRPQPLHAVWLPPSLPAVEASLASSHPAPKAVLENVNVRWVPEEEWHPWDPEARSFTNMNTPEDLQREHKRYPPS